MMVCEVELSSCEIIFPYLSDRSHSRIEFVRREVPHPIVAVTFVTFTIGGLVKLIGLIIGIWEGIADGDV